LIVFGAGTVYVLRLIGLGPVPHEGKQPIEGGPGRERTPARPFSAAPGSSTTHPAQEP